MKRTHHHSIHALILIVCGGILGVLAFIASVYAILGDPASADVNVPAMLIPAQFFLAGGLFLLYSDL